MQISDFILQIGRKADDPANLLESITHNLVLRTPVSSMTWDADSNRVSFTSSTGGTWEFVYDITAGIPAVIKETGSEYTKTYVREPDGSLIAMFVGSYPYYYHFDALGSTRMLTDESGHITDTYTYDAWGNASHDSGTTLQPYQYVGQLGYYTHYQDANLPLLQLGVRFYDPGTGRFTQVDPLPQYGRSTYAYAYDSPVSLRDPRGESPETCMGLCGPILQAGRNNCKGQADVSACLATYWEMFEKCMDACENGAIPEPCDFPWLPGPRPKPGRGTPPPPGRGTPPPPGGQPPAPGPSGPYPGPYCVPVYINWTPVISICWICFMPDGGTEVGCTDLW